jgi:hypothetical protein
VEVRENAEFRLAISLKEEVGLRGQGDVGRADKGCYKLYKDRLDRLIFVVHAL